ncbi:MAG TPA: helix-turn-helix transcriptional regulator [Isosphaeraceae bacterium]|nr:helix-turn-helix transcriptional regulator [Isosphaeraceae bacterium]
MSEHDLPDLPEVRREIGKRIILARNELGMKQVELAELLGVAERTMQAYESGEVVPYRRLRELERVLNRPMAWFLHGDAAEEKRDVQLDEIRAEAHRVFEINERRNGLLVEIRDLLQRLVDQSG